MRKNYNELKINDLKELCKKRNIKGYSRLKKDDLISLLKADDEKKALANNNARIELGVDFAKAKAFWANINNKKPKAEDLDDVISTWKVMSSLASESVMSGSLIEIATSISNIFNLDYSVENKTDEELADFINTMINQFKTDTQTEVLHKSGYKIIKASLSDVFVDNGKALFNSANASVFTQDEIKIMREQNGGKIYTMRVVETSENGFSRMLEELGEDVTYLMLYMGDTETSEGWGGVEINQLKELIFMDGLCDINTGVHYNFGIKGPSMDRKANHLFIPVEGWKETFDLWFKITGTKDLNGFKDAFGEEVVLAKVLARVSTRGSSSFDISRVSPEVSEVISKAKVYYSKDTETTVSRTYHQLVKPNVLEERSGERSITDSDGQGLISVSMNANVALAMKTITRNEYTEFVTLWKNHNGNLAEVNPASRLGKLIIKIPNVWQIRHGEKKGLLVMADLENIEATKNWDIICPESVRKFVGGEWSEYPLEICNFLKKKDSVVHLNPQFIEALDWDNPNELIPIAKDIFNFAEESMTDVKKRMEFHKIFVSDNDTSASVGSFLVDAIIANNNLMNETQVQKWSLSQYKKMIDNLKIGRIPVPGMYSYMIFDPYYLINKIFGLNLETLKYGEFYHNGLDCRCGLFRSPLIHPFEAQNVQLVNNDTYWYLKDCIIFNGFDGTADRMGGADMDGDTCAIIPDNTPEGKTIVDGIRCLDFDVWEPAQKATKVYFVPDANDDVAMRNLISHLVKGAKVDRTGIITNYASRALDIANHLKSAIHFAKLMGCENLTFFHPEAFGRQNKYGATFVPQAMYYNGTKTFGLKGIVKGRYVEEPIGSGNFKVVWNNDAEEAIIGVKTFNEVEVYIQKYLRIVEILRVLQGREIDGAKTGVFAEGVSGLDFTDNVKITNSPHTMLTRQVSLGRRSGEERMDSAFINSYITLSPWGRVHDFIDQYLYNADGTTKTGTFLDTLENNGVDKSYVLWNLLTEEERTMLRTYINFSDGSKCTLIELMSKFKSNYGSTIRNLKLASNEIKSELCATQGDDIKAEDVLGNLTIGKIKEKQYIELEQYMESLKVVLPNINMKVMAAACYLATYMGKDGNPTSGISFAWIIPDALLEIFSRENEKYGWVRVPNSANNVSVKDNILYVDGKIIDKINAYDTPNALTKFINNRLYAWIQRRVAEVAEPSAIVENTIVSNKVYTIRAMGFKYYSSGNVEGWKKLVASNNYMFDIIMEKNEDKETGRVVMSINGMPIASLATGKDGINMSTVELIGRKVKVVNNPNSNPIVFNNNSITNICVAIV